MTNNKLIYRMCLISMFTALTCAIYAFTRFVIPVIPSSIAPPELHLIVALIASFLLLEIFDVLIFAIITSVLTCLIGGWGFQTLPFDYFVPIILCGSSFYIRKLKTKIMLNFIFIPIYFSTIFTLIFFSHTLSGMLFYEFTFAESAILNIAYVAVTLGLSIPICVPLFKWGQTFLLAKFGKL